MLEQSIDGAVATLTLNRPEKRNAMSDALLARIEEFFSDPPAGVRAVVLHGAGAHFCAGLDLSEHHARPEAEAVMRHSRGWHRVLDMVHQGGLPVVSALQGAVIGGGLELAAATHVRVAEPGCIFQLPEGQRGIFVGGGATVRIGRILGADRTTEMMLTGRSYDTSEALHLGLAHHAAAPGQGLARARELAARIASNARLSNYLVIQAMARIEDMAKADGFFTESLCAALAQTSPDAAEGMAAFLQKRAPNFR